MADASLENAAIAAQRAVRGHQARKQVETQKLYAEYEAQMAEMQQQQKQQLDEGMRLVAADKLRKDSEKELLLKRSSTFVEQFEENEARRRLNLLMATLMRSKKWLRRLRKRLAAAVLARKEEAARKVAEAEAARKAALLEEETRKAEKARRRQAELEAIEREFVTHQAEREAKAQESVRLVEKHASEMDLLHAELSLAAATANSHGSDPETKIERKQTPQQPNQSPTKKHQQQRAASISSPTTPLIATKTLEKSSSRRHSTNTMSIETSTTTSSSGSFLPASLSPRGDSSSSPTRSSPSKGTDGQRVSWVKTPAIQAALTEKQQAAEAAAYESLSSMTVKALLALQETLQVGFFLSAVVFLCRVP